MITRQAQNYGETLNHDICRRCFHERQAHEVVATPLSDDQYAEQCWGNGDSSCSCSGFKDFRNGIPARNMGLHGGEDMGIALNGALMAAWQQYQRDLELLTSNPEAGIIKGWIRADKRVMRVLCGIRKAGRMGIS